MAGSENLTGELGFVSGWQLKYPKRGLKLNSSKGSNMIESSEGCAHSPQVSFDVYSKH